MSPALSRHLGAVLGSLPVSFDERDLIVDEAETAENYNDLSVGVRALLDDIQTRLRSSGSSSAANRLPTLVNRSRERLNRSYSRDSDGRFSSGGGGVRAVLANAGTVGEISAAASAEAGRITGRDIEFDLAGSDPQIAREHAEGVLQGLESYPGAPLRRVQQGADLDTEAAGKAAAITNTDTGTIAFTDYAQSAGADAYRAGLARDEGAGDIVAGSPKGVALHEFGHVVAEHGGAGPAADAVVASRAKKIGQSKDDYVGDHISNYATENHHELTAEAFADVHAHGSDASDASRAIVKVIDQLYVIPPGNRLTPTFHQYVRQIRDRTYKRDKDGQFASGTGGGGVRDALAGHETAEEVATAAAAEAKRITGRDIEFDFGGSDPQIAAEHSEGILQGLERFPKTPLKRVQQGGEEWAEGREAWASTARDGSTITFTDDAQKYGAAGYRGDLKQAKQAGDIAVATPTGVALHEFGHAVANGYGANDRTLQAAYDHMSSSKKPTSEVIRSSLGRYATSGDREMIAEGFATSMLRGDKAPPLAKAISDGLQAAVDSGVRGHPGG